MSRETSLFRGLLVFGLCVPLALFLGYQLATPMQRTSIFWIGLALCLLAIPILLRWHHDFLILTWNASLVAFFLPGRPGVGYLIGGMSLFFSVMKRALTRERTFIRCPSVSIPLIFLAGIVLFTARETGGIHANAFGSDTWGAMRYFWVFGAIAAYFALIGQPIAPQRAKLLASLFFLSGVVSLLPGLMELFGLRLGFLQVFFSVGTAGSAEPLGVFNQVERFTGFMIAALAFCSFMMVKYGIRGIFDLHRPWRLGTFAVAFLLGLLGGFRSFVVLMFLLFCIQFYFERLLKTVLFGWFVLSGILLAAFIVLFADRLPLAMQRSISFLPVHISPVAQHDATSTLNWRVEMWRATLPSVPKYLLLGKGFNFDSTDYHLTQLGAQRGFNTAYDFAMVSSDFHQGILTLIIPFGIFGALAFAAFCWASVRALYANYRYGDPDLRLVNTFLLSYFIARLAFYVVLYGQFDGNLMLFTGTIGLSLSINGGVRQRASVPVLNKETKAVEDLTLQPA